MQGFENEEGMKPLLLEHDRKPRENKCLGVIKAKKWFIIFGLGLLLGVGIIVGFVATKSNSNVDCGVDPGSSECFFKGVTRLPKNIIPLSYKLRLEPNLHDFTFTGSILMTVTCEESTNRVVFHQRGLTFGKGSVSVRKSKERNGELKIEEMRADEQHEQMIIKMKQPLQKGDEYAIIVQYNGKINEEKLEGFYKSSYKNKQGEIRYLATTHFEATSARNAFPCFDEPEMKAKFTIVIRHPIGSVALSNMPAESSKILPNNLNETMFMESVKMSTYLVAFVVCDFDYVENITESGVTVRVWAPPGMIKEAGLALKSASVVLDYYEKYFGIKYPLPKQDLIAIPDFSAGAMENWGLITYRLTSLLVDPGQSSDGNKQWVATVVAHELAHQWFGNLVTMKWWDDLWLNEGFASYVESIGVNIFQPKWKMMDQFIISNIQTSMHLDELATSHPISAVVKDPNEISSLFDGISYHKGASLIHMMDRVLGSDAFLKGVQGYLKKYKFGNAATDDLWESLSEHTDVNVKKVMDTWTLQMGFPLVTITKESDGVYKASQEHFLINPDTKPTQESPYDYKWFIPLTYRTDKDDKMSKIHWMRGGDTTIEVDISKDGWLKGNHEQNGFYRVNYPVENWENIVKTLNTDHTKLSTADRAGLIDDAFSLARAGKLTYSVPLDITSYLHKEQDYVVWAAALNGLAYIQGRLSMTPYYGIYQKYLLSKIEPVLQSLSYQDEGEHLQRYLRDVIFGVAVFYDSPPATKEAKKMFDEFKVDDKPVPPNFRRLVYNFGVRNGGMEEWEVMFQKYKKELVASEKSLFLSSISQSRRPWLLQRSLEYSLNTSLIKSQDADTVLARVASSSNGRLLAWDFFEENWPELFKRYGSEAFSLGRLVKSVAAHFQTEFHFEQVKSFFKTNSDHGSAERSIQQTYETIKSNIRWMKNYQNEVVTWLKKH